MDEEQLKDLIVRSYVENYTKGWDAAMKHLKDSIVKGIVNDGVISTNVDVDHLERIVRIIEETK
jgi:type VI protein secretion system component VasK